MLFASLCVDRRREAVRRYRLQPLNEAFLSASPEALDPGTYRLVPVPDRKGGGRE